MRERGLVHTLADERVVHVGHGHEARRHGDGVALEAFGVARAIPLLLVAVGDFLGHAEERHAHAQAPLGLLDGIAPQRGVGFHDLELLHRQLARLEQDGVGDADLADVVQRRRLVQQVDHAVGEHVGEARVVAQVLGQGLHVQLGATDVVAGLVVARLGQRGHGHDGHVLDGLHLQRAQRHLALQVGALVAQEVGRGLERQVRGHARQQDGRADGLGDVVHRPQLQAQALVLHVGARGEEDHGNVARVQVRLEPAADLIAVHARHHDVEQDEVGRLLALRDLQRLLPLVGHLHVVVVAQQPAHEREVVGRVVHHEHRGDRLLDEHRLCIKERGMVHECSC